jgi:hypothetical protein
MLAVGHRNDRFVRAALMMPTTTRKRVLVVSHPCMIYRTHGVGTEVVETRSFGTVMRAKNKQTEGYNI